MDFVGTDSRLRFVYNDNRIHFLIAPLDAETADDSAFKRDTTYLMVLNAHFSRTGTTPLQSVSIIVFCSSILVYPFVSAVECGKILFV